MSAVAFSRTVQHGGGGDGTAALEKLNYIERVGRQAPAVEYPLTAVQNDLVWQETTGQLPGWARDTRDFFTSAEKYERSNAAVLTEFKFDLPKELPREQQLALARDFFKAYLGDDHVVAWAMHEPSGLDGTLHPHVHAIWSARPVTPNDLSAKEFFSRKNPKTPDLNHFHAPTREKQTYTDVANVYLAQAGLALRYHPMSYKERGVAMTPEPKILPSDSYAYAKTGVASERLQAALDHRAAMEPHRAEEQADAAAYWERRTQELGMAQDMSHAQRLARIRLMRTPPVTSPTKGELNAERLRLQQSITRVERYQRQIDDATKQKLTERTNPVVLRKLDYLLSYDLDHEEETAGMQGGTFHWQKDRDVSR
jgi:hypothetical protein